MRYGRLGITEAETKKLSENPDIVLITLGRLGWSFVLTLP
jgi:hypothetical protein